MVLPSGWAVTAPLPLLPLGSLRLICRLCSHRSFHLGRLSPNRVLPARRADPATGAGPRRPARPPREPRGFCSPCGAAARGGHTGARRWRRPASSAVLRLLSSLPPPLTPAPPPITAITPPLPRPVPAHPTRPRPQSSALDRPPRPALAPPSLRPPPRPPRACTELPGLPPRSPGEGRLGVRVVLSLPSFDRAASSPRPRLEPSPLCPAPPVPASAQGRDRSGAAPDPASPTPTAATPLPPARCHPVSLIRVGAFLLGETSPKCTAAEEIPPCSLILVYLVNTDV